MMNKSFTKMLGSVVTALLLVACAGGPNERSTGEVFDDTTVLTKTKAALVQDPDIKGSAIHVQVDRGVVTLTGTVRSEAERKKAVDTAYGIKGVKSVQTDLKVQPPNP